MLDSKSKLKRVGFSTGALEKGDFKTALHWLQENEIQDVEISALRLEELESLVSTLESLPIKKFSYVSFHAPSSFPKEMEKHVVQLLGKVASYGSSNWNIIVHPDVIRKPKLWKRFNSHLLIENMDRRKSIGRTVSELDKIFKCLPDAKLCLDLAHARQLDTTLTLLAQLILRFSTRIAEIHISELDSRYQHQLMSDSALNDYKNFTGYFNSSIPVIIESTLDGDRARFRMNEFDATQAAMRPRGKQFSSSLTSVDIP